MKRYSYNDGKRHRNAEHGRQQRQTHGIIGSPRVAHSSSPAACHPRTMLLTVTLGRSDRSSSGRLVSGELQCLKLAAGRYNKQPIAVRPLRVASCRPQQRARPWGSKAGAAAPP
jgi:hypothetical protein